MKTVIRSCIALAAILAVPPLAYASPELTSPTGTKAPVGTKVIATNVAHSSTSKTVKLTHAQSGNIECATATATGELTSNTGSHIAGNITTVDFSGKPGMEPHGPDCTWPLFGNTTITPSHFSNPCHSSISGNHCSLPWCVTANTADDKFTVRGGACNEAARPVTFRLVTSSFECSYQKASVAGTYTTHPADAVATVEKQVFTRTTGSAFCPIEFSLDMALTLATDINGVSGEAIWVK
jgi:hypothetical protein